MEIPFFETDGFSEESPKGFLSPDFFFLFFLNSKSADVPVKHGLVNCLVSFGINLRV